MVAASDIDQAFANMICAIDCPACGEKFTNFAVTWGDAWRQGRHDHLLEIGGSERDGPLKVKCELCESKSWVNYFANTATLAT